MIDDIFCAEILIVEVFWKLLGNFSPDQPTKKKCILKNFLSERGLLLRPNIISYSS